MNYSNYTVATSSDSMFGNPIVLTGVEYDGLTSVEKQDPSKLYYIVDDYVCDNITAATFTGDFWKHYKIDGTAHRNDMSVERFNCKHCGAVNQIGVCEYCGSAKE